MNEMDDFKKRFEALVTDLGRGVGDDVAVVVYAVRGSKVSGAVFYGEDAPSGTRRVIDAFDDAIRGAAALMGGVNVKEREVEVADRLEGRWVRRALGLLGDDVNVLGVLIEFRDHEMELAPTGDGGWRAIPAARANGAIEGLGPLPRAAVTACSAALISSATMKRGQA